jgi:hypothetical protein
MASLASQTPNRLLGQRLAVDIDGDPAHASFGALKAQRKLRSTTSRTRRASAITSGPMPSPERTAILKVFIFEKKGAYRKRLLRLSNAEVRFDCGSRSESIGTIRHAIEARGGITGIGKRQPSRP